MLVYGRRKSSLQGSGKNKTSTLISQIIMQQYKSINGLQPLKDTDVEKYLHPKVDLKVIHL